MVKLETMVLVTINISHFLDMVDHMTNNGAVFPSTFGNLIISWETANLLMLVLISLY